MRIYRMNSRGRPTRNGPPDWVLGEVLRTSHRKNLVSLRIRCMCLVPCGWADRLVRPKQWKMEYVRFSLKFLA